MFPQEIPEQFSWEGDAEEEEGNRKGQSPWQGVLLPTSTAPAPGRSGDATSVQAGSNVRQPRRIPALQGPHRVYFVKGCSASPPASRTPPNRCRLPQPLLQPGPAPRGHASPGRAGKFSAGRHAPMGRFGSGEILVILKISKSQPPNGARQRLAPRPSLRFPSLEPAGTLSTDETLSCGPSKASGSLF